MSGECRHEPTLTIMSGAQFVTSVLCPCRKCWLLLEFPVSPPPDRPKLTLVK